MSLRPVNDVALKEWAVVCRALEIGRQIVTLRKGGIHEPNGAFRPEHDEFWLYPTYEHQRREEIVEDAWPLLETVQTCPERVAGQLTLRLYARVVLAQELSNLESALALRGLHIWTEEAIRQRFTYRRPGLSLLALRIYRIPMAHRLPELPRYAGCRSWVKLERPLSTTGAEPVLSDTAFAEKLDVLRQCLNGC